MSDTGTATAEPITLQAFVPAELRIDDNARTDAEATINKECVAQLKEHAKVPSPDGLREPHPCPLVRCPDGELESPLRAPPHPRLYPRRGPPARLHRWRQGRQPGRSPRPAARPVTRTPAAYP